MIDCGCPKPIKTKGTLGAWHGEITIFWVCLNCGKVVFVGDELK